MIALARFRRGAARPRVRPVHRDAFRTDAALVAEIERIGDEGRVVRLLRTRGPHQDIASNGPAWLVLTVPRRWEPIGSFPTAAAALRDHDRSEAALIGWAGLQRERAGRWKGQLLDVV